MKKQKHNSARRRFLNQLAASGAVSIGAGASMIPSFAGAQTSGGYKALVCVFMYGGNDGLNMVPPTAAQANSRYASVRGGLALSGSEIIDLNGEIGFHNRLAPLVPYFQDQTLAVVNNVGVLSRPTSQAEYFQWAKSSDNSLVPDNLFSHSDQQILWETGTANALTRTGWAGRLMEVLGAAAPVYAFGKPSRFGEGEFTQQLALPDAGNQLGLQGFSSGNAWANTRLVSFANSQFSAFETSNTLGEILEQEPGNGVADPANPEISEAFGNFAGDTDNKLSRQLYQVAKLIKNRASVGGSQHVYFVTLDGFDFHNNQRNRQDELLNALGLSLAGFQESMKALGVADQVTLFTESDFGRTFKPNNSGGTDHGWGNQQLVLGGAVNGGIAHGAYPSLILNMRQP